MAAMTPINCKNRRSLYPMGKLQESTDLQSNHVHAIVTASTGNTFVAHPSSRTSSTEDFTTLSTNTNMLCLDRGNTDSNPVGFTGTSAREQSNTTRLSNVWSTYGSYVLVTVTGANFYARQTGTDGLYSLLWSSSAEAMTDTIPLVLRTTEPATVSVLT